MNKNREKYRQTKSVKQKQTQIYKYIISHTKTLTTTRKHTASTNNYSLTELHTDIDTRNFSSIYSHKLTLDDTI